MTSMFDYLKPTAEEERIMQIMRNAAADYHAVLQAHLPEGPDKTYTVRKLREVAMWANVAITRNLDGTARR